MQIRLGYATDNLELKEKGIFTNRTARLATVKKTGVQHLVKIALDNINDLLTILAWNEKHNIRFYRITSGLLPHITNEQLIPTARRGDYRALAYSLEPFTKLFRQIGSFARKWGHRLTFHPDPFINLGSLSVEMITRNTRELYYHALVMDTMKLNLNSTITIHGGGVYGAKESAMLRWVDSFNKLPRVIKRRVVLENDEFTYSVMDVLWLSSNIKPITTATHISRYHIPIVLDIFHYYCYNRTIELKELEAQPTIEQLIPHIISSWGKRRVKMHLSEQHPCKTRGAHADFVRYIPKEILAFPKKTKRNLDLMLEAKAKEKALLVLRDLYNL